MKDRTDKTPRRRHKSYRECMLDEMPIRQVLRRLRNVQQVMPDQYSASCPLCDGGSRHLTVSEDADGKVLMHCHHDCGCTFEAIVGKLGLQVADLFPDKLLAPRPLREISGHARPALAHNTARMPAERPAANANRRQSDDWAALSEGFQAELTPKLMLALEMELRLEYRYLTELRLGWSAPRNVYTWPEVDGHGRVIGIATRAPRTGVKGFLAAGRRGLYIPSFMLKWAPQSNTTLPTRRRAHGKNTRPIYIVEGPTDTAAMLAMGMLAIGRPSARSGVDHLVEWLARHASSQKIIVVGEIDAKSDGTWTGRDAAESVANQLSARLRRNVGWTLPPDDCKDVRAWYIRWRSM
jgi:hypothetical protein